MAVLLAAINPVLQVFEVVLKGAKVVRRALRAVLGALQAVPCALRAVRRASKAVSRAGMAVRRALDLFIQSLEVVPRASKARLSTFKACYEGKSQQRGRVMDPIRPCCGLLSANA